MTLIFRRICTVCRKPVSWEPLPARSPADDDWQGRFFHVVDQTGLCEGASVDLETKEVEEGPAK